MIVILCDGSSKGNPGPATIGVVAWDRAHNPRLVYPNFRLSKDIGNCTNMEAEWYALLNALSYAHTKDTAQDIYIFCDSQTVVKQANSDWRVKHDNIKPLYEQFIALKTPLSKLHIFWVPRQLVYLADKAAQRGGNNAI